MSELPASETAFKRHVRIQCQPDKDSKLLGIATSILDAETGDVITNVAKVCITVDPGDINKAEITYYESDADGKLLVKDGDVVVSTVESIDPEVDITAFEVKPAQANVPLAAEGFSPFIIIHEYDPSKELLYIPAATDASVFPNNYVQQQEALWQIAETVAERDSMYWDSNGIWRCPFCGENKHDDDCVVTKARTLMEWRKAQPKITIQVQDNFSPAVSPIAEIAHELAEKVKDLNEEEPGD